MSFLKTLGTVSIAVGKVIPGVSPFAMIAGALIPGEKDDKAIAKTLTTIDQIAGVIITAERMGAAIAAPGATKLQMAAPEVANLLLQWARLQGHEVADPAKVQAGAQKVADGVADFLNGLKA